MELKINGKTLLGLTFLSAGLAFGDFVSLINANTSGGITIEKEVMDIGSVVLRMDSTNPSTIYGGTWNLISGDASLRFGDGTDQAGTVQGADNDPLVPIPLHNHGINHDHPVATTSTDSHYHQMVHNNESTHSDVAITSSNYISVRGHKSGWSNDYAYVLRGNTNAPNTARTSTDSHNHTLDIPNFVGNSQNAGVADAKINVRGKYITVNVWEKVGN